MVYEGGGERTGEEVDKNENVSLNFERVREGEGIVITHRLKRRKWIFVLGLFRIDSSNTVLPIEI